MNRRKIKGLIAAAAIIGVTAASPSVIAKASEEPTAVRSEESVTNTTNTDATSSNTEGENTTINTNNNEETTTGQTSSSNTDNNDTTNQGDSDTSDKTRSETTGSTTGSDVTGSENTGDTEGSTTEDTTETETPLDKATAAVGAAEKSLKKSDYDAAKALVDALEEDAETLVKTAEDNKTRDDYNAASEKVTSLDETVTGTSGATKNSLEDRLNAVLVEIEKEEKVKSAQDAVSLAQDTLKKADYDNAKTLVEALDEDAPGETTKSSLLANLDSIVKDVLAKAKEEAENLAKAQDAVQKALKSETREDYEIAKPLVDALNESDDKLALEESLSNLLENIELNEDIELQEDARVKVEAAEKDMTRSNYDAAKAAVLKINDKDIKGLYEDRLKIVYETVKATEESLAKDLVETAEKVEIRDNYTVAKAAVDALDDGDLKTELQGKLASVLQDIDKAEQVAERIAAKAAVLKSEEDGTRDNYNAAKKLVDALNPCNDKTDLEERLGRVIAYLEDKEEAAAEVLVKNCEGDSSRESYEIAKKAVDALDNTEGKEKLEARLETVLNNIVQAEEVGKRVVATQAVVKAESDISMDSYNEAKKLVDELLDGTAKNSLLTRLSAVLFTIEDNAKDSMFSQADRNFLNNIDLSKVTGDSASDKTTIAIDNTLSVNLPANFINNEDLQDTAKLELSCVSQTISQGSKLQNLLDSNNYQALGKKLDFTLNATYNNGTSNLIKNFVKPVEFKIAFTDSELQGFNKDLLKMAYYDEEAGKLVLLDTYWDGNVCTFSTNHFSSYVLVELPEVSDNNNGGNTSGTDSNNKPQNVVSNNIKKADNTESKDIIKKVSASTTAKTSDNNAPFTCAGLLVCSAALVLMAKKRR